MKLREMKLGLVALALALTAPVTVSAEEGVGYLDVTVGRAEIDDFIPGWKWDAGTSFSLGAGYSFSENIAVEARYIDFGDIEDNLAPIWTLHADALVIDVVASYPLSDKVAIFAKAGFFTWNAELTEAGFGELASDDGTDMTFGAGFAVNFTGNLSSYVQFKRYAFEVEGEDLDLDDISIGLQYRF